VLNSSGLAASRLGVVLTSAAMMDDVVGLVMVQVISNLGGDNFSWITVVRPVLVSVAFAVVTPLVCVFMVKPLTLWFNQYQVSHPPARLTNLLRKTSTVFVIHTLILISLVTGATYAGTSNLFAAYIAGASISWWDSEVPHSVAKATTPQAAGGDEQEKVVSAPGTKPTDHSSPAESASNSRDIQATQSESRDGHNANTEALHPAGEDKHNEDASGPSVYSHYYHPAVSKILQPLFFASVGFSIPITKMFNGPIVWRGVVYTVLMALGKLVCGLWLVRFTKSAVPSKGTASHLLSRLHLPPHLWGKSEATTSRAPNAAHATTNATSQANSSYRSSPNPPKPFSLHPPLMLAFAMCARGEIGFLISGVAESNGVFSGSGETSSNGPSDIFLVVTWAIVLCTILGPLGVGLSVRRVKKLEEQKNRRHGEGAGRDVLGVWGVS
jgi:Kef-type K+ transport system membrane component KefB